MDATTNLKWAKRWLTASGLSDAVFNGQTIRAWGKDEAGYLVAVRTDAGIFPVQNLPAVLYHEHPSEPLKIKRLAAKADNGRF
jgi:hypothetical protein